MTKKGGMGAKERKQGLVRSMPRTAPLLFPFYQLLFLNLQSGLWQNILTYGIKRKALLCHSFQNRILLNIIWMDSDPFM
jgi:hypothetical protein